MENLAYIHLELAREAEQQPQPQQQAEPIGASWDETAWDELFEEIDRDQDEQE